MHRISRSSPAIRALLRVTYPDYQGRIIRVRAYDGPQWLRVSWDEGSRDYVRLVDARRGLADLRVDPPYVNPDGALGHVDQPPGSLLVVHSIAAGRDRGITITVRHPEPGAMGIAGIFAGLLNA